jgi:fluoroacetyl-CoA thioesterase
VAVRIGVTATLTEVDGRLLRFEIVAEHPDGRVVATGAVSRVVVDRARFVARAAD